MDPRAEYWTQRYQSGRLDWADGVHIGRFDGLPSDATIEEATREADNALVRSIYENCSLFRLVTGFRVLEIGCGGGGLAFRLSEAIPKLRYVGLDIASTAIATASGRARANDPRPESQNGSQMRFMTSSAADTLKTLEAEEDADYEHFDLIIVREVFYLLSNDERVTLAQLLRSRLRPGGFVYFADIFRLRTEAGAVLQEHLYDRHKSPGEQLALPALTEAAFADWAENAFGEGFLLSAHSFLCDVHAVARTYNAALRTPVSDAHKLAYKKLAELGKPSSQPALGYVTVFLFASGAVPPVAWGERDYHFTASRNLANAILADQSYGVKGECWTLLLGRSGAGKTSLLRALEGEMNEIVGQPKRLLEDVRYFFLSQDIDLFDTLSPVDNVRAFATGKRNAEDLLAKLGLRAPFLARHDSIDISGGERQRVAIAQCITSRADVILLDEPLKGLDKARRAVLFELLDSQLRRPPRSDQAIGERVTLVCVDHDFDTIYRRFDFVYEVINGHQVLVWQK